MRSASKCLLGRHLGEATREEGARHGRWGTQQQRRLARQGGRSQERSWRVPKGTGNHAPVSMQRGGGGSCHAERTSRST